MLIFTHQPPISALMHSFRLFRKWITGDTRAAEFFMYCLGTAQSPAIRRFVLTFVSELVTLPTGEQSTTVQEGPPLCARTLSRGKETTA